MSVNIVCAATASPDGQHAPSMMTSVGMPDVALAVCQYCTCLYSLLQAPGTSEVSLVDIVTSVSVKPDPITKPPIKGIS
jgi:hypothetical protein